jgi:hypothetical protein
MPGFTTHMRGLSDINFIVLYFAEILMRDTQVCQNSGDISNSSQLVYPGTLIVSLDLLAVLPSVVDEVDISRQTKLLLNDQLIQFSGPLFESVEKVLLYRNNCFHPHELVAMLRLLRAWLAASGITLSHLADKHPSLFLFMLTCLRSAVDPHCLQEASLSIQALVSVSEYPRPQLRSSAVAMVLQAWAGGQTSEQSMGVGVGVGAFVNPSLQYLLQNTGEELMP